MNRYFRLLSVSVVVMVVLTLGIAQNTASAQGTSGLGGVRTPGMEADTGAFTSDFDHLKAAEDYFRTRATSGEVKDWGEVNRIGYNAFSQMGNSIAYKAESASWISIAGSVGGHASGRARSIAFDPKDPNTVYIATASGGIWRTTNANATSPIWVSLSDGKLPTSWMGAIAVDPNDGQTLYAGTGEVIGGWSPAIQNSNVTPPGTGIYKSTDGGMNWTQVAAESLSGPSCGAIAVDPSNSQHIYAATGNSVGGLLISSNGGGTWAKASTAGNDPVSIAIDLQNNKNVYVGLQSGGVYRSADGGATWTKCVITGGVAGRSIATTQVAVAPSDPKTVYASISSGGGQQGNGTYGIAMSNDFGATWTLTNKCTQSTTNGQPVSPSDPSQATNYPQANYLWIQGHYGNAIAVNPQNSTEILVGGVDIWSSQDGGATLKATGFSAGQFNNSYYTHADVHALAYQGNTLWACTDGGLANSVSNGSSWNTAVNQGLATLQFVGVDGAADFSYVLGGVRITE